MFKQLLLAGLVATVLALPSAVPDESSECFKALDNSREFCQNFALEHVDPQKVIIWGELKTECCMMEQVMECLKKKVDVEPTCKLYKNLVKGVFVAETKELLSKKGCKSLDKC